jgi:hypothetical protein
MKIRYQGEKSIVTFCESVQTGKGRDIELGSILDRIRSDEFKERIGDIRAADRLERGRLKKSLPAIIPTGSLDGGRVAGNRMIPRSGVVVLDFDHLSGKDFYQVGVSTEAEDLKDLLKADPFNVAAFFSPSGDGVKALIRCDDFEAALPAMFDYYERITGDRPDEQCKNVNRLCFVSHDPDLFVNYSAKEFPVSPKIYFAQNQGSQFDENHSFDGVRSLNTLDKASPAPPLICKSVGHSPSLYDTPGKKDAATLILAGKKAKKDFSIFHEKEAVFFTRWIEQIFTPKQGSRNRDLGRIVTFLFHAVNERILILLAKQFYKQNQHLWADSFKQHVVEIKAFLKSVRAGYLDSLTNNERKIYESLSENEQAAFRVCRDLASRKKADTDNATFFLSSKGLADRIDYHGRQAHRLLRKFIKWKLLTILKKGERWKKNKKPLATEYRWLGSTTDSSIYNKEENP